MAVPKKRRSHTRKGKRRSHQALKKRTLSKDTETEELSLPHRIGPSGYYRGKLIDPRAAWSEYQ